MGKLFSGMKRDDVQLIQTTSYVQFVQGFFVIIMGALLPYIRAEYGLNYAVSGALVSAESVGKLIGSFIACYIAMGIGAKRSLALLNSVTYIGFAIMLFTGNPIVLIIAFVCMGFGRGTTLNYNSDTMNRLPGKDGLWMTYTQTFFALGALIAPLLVSVCIDRAGFSWRLPDIIVVILGAVAVLMVSRVKLSWYDDALAAETKTEDKAQKNFGFLKSKVFWIVVAIGFCYCSFEASVMGWAATYFLDSGAIAENYVQVIVSLIWAGFLVGRVVCTGLVNRFRSDKLVLVLSLLTLAFYLVMLFCHSLAAIVLGVFGLGLGISGIYTLNIAGISHICRKYTAAMGFYMTITLVGAIAIPSVVGGIAERFNISAGMKVLVVIAAIQLIMSVVNVMYRRKFKAGQDTIE